MTKPSFPLFSALWSICETERGTIAAKRVVVATNAFTSRLFPELSDIKFFRSQVLNVEHVEDKLRGIIADCGFVERLEMGLYPLPALDAAELAARQPPPRAAEIHVRRAATVELTYRA